MPSANDPAEETSDGTRRERTMSYEGLWIPEDPGELILEVSTFSRRSSIDTGS